MKTLDMMIAAEGTNDWYHTGEMWYNAFDGFISSEMKPWPGYAFNTLNDLFALNWTKENAPIRLIRLTRKEVREKYGVTVID